MLLRISQETGVRAQRRMGPCRIRRRQEYQFIGPTPYPGQYRLTAALTNGVPVESYGYDALGRRAWVTASGVTTHFVNDGPHIVAETDDTGVVLRRYEYGPGMDDILSMTVINGQAETTYRYLKDHLNTVIALVDGQGEIVESYEYDAWGNVLAVRDGAGNPLTESALGNRFLFQGREYSWATGLYNFRARWYDPETGRWLSNDPIGISGGLNQYVFCGNNPVNFRDPYGLCSEDEGIGFWDWAQGVLDAGGIVEPTPFCDLGSSIISMFRGNWGDAGWSLLGVVPYVGDLGKAGKYGSKALKYSDEAAALVDLAKQAKRTGVSPADADTLLKWADEVHLPRRGPEIHPKRTFDVEHIHIGPVDHIPVNP